MAKINYVCSSAHNAPEHFGARLHIYGFRSTNNHLVEAWGHLNATTGAVPTHAVHPVVEVRFQDFRVLVPRAPAVWFQHTWSGRFPEPLPRAQDIKHGIVKPCASAKLVGAYPEAFQGIEQECVCGENRWRSSLLGSVWALQRDRTARAPVARRCCGLSIFMRYSRGPDPGRDRMLGLHGGPLSKREARRVGAPERPLRSTDLWRVALLRTEGRWERGLLGG